MGIAYSTEAHAVGTTTSTINDTVTAADGDIIGVGVCHPNTAAPSAPTMSGPSGSVTPTRLGTVSRTGESAWVGYYKVPTGGAGSYTVSGSVTTGGQVWAILHTGSDATTAVDDLTFGSNNAAATTATSTTMGAATAYDLEWAIAILCQNVGTGATLTDPSGYALRTNSRGAINTSGALHVLDSNADIALGTTSVASFTSSSSQPRVQAIYGIVPTQGAADPFPLAYFYPGQVGGNAVYRM